MSTAAAIQPDFNPSETNPAAKLGDEITELCGYIHAASAHLLKLIREFDEQRYWEDAGEEETIPIAARRADALCEMAETSLNNPENAGSTADRYLVTLHVETTGDSHLENGPHDSSRNATCAEGQRRRLPLSGLFQR